jgi:hypothetical protein
LRGTDTETDATGGHCEPVLRRTRIGTQIAMPGFCADNGIQSCPEPKGAKKEPFFLQISANLQGPIRIAI